jgi:serine/threonine-protein kinase RsbW
METNSDFKISRASNRLAISFTSTMGNIDQADKETKKFLKDIGLEFDTFGVCLVMREGMTNAVRHGNRFDSSKFIRYSLEFRDDRLTMEIEDQGEGFSWQAASTTLPHPESDHGRGISIMREYFNEYTYNDTGNKLILSKIYKKKTE